MRIQGWLVLGAMCGWLAWGCDDFTIPSGTGDADEVDPISGKYSFWGYDENETLIVTGHITIAVDDAGKVTGTWHLKAEVSDTLVTGQMLGDGTLVGGVDGQDIYINLNPGWADNNVFLLGTAHGAYIIGKWEHLGFAGVLATGSFVAVRVKN